MGEYLKTAEGVAAVVIAIYVASIGTFQWFTAREKLRLDLYNRRFEAYASTITYMQTVLDWKLSTAKARFDGRTAFIRAMLESGFLFADNPAIEVLLEEFNTRSFQMTNFNDTLSDIKSAYLPDFGENEALYQTNVRWVIAARNQLRIMLAPYLAFRHREMRRSIRSIFRRRG
jgi:hypothetical protein